jgi:hypothetical protein
MKDSDALCSEILRLLADEDLAEQLGEHGRKMVYPDFDVSTSIRKMERMYEELTSTNLNCSSLGSLPPGHVSPR